MTVRVAAIEVSDCHALKARSVNGAGLDCRSTRYAACLDRPRPFVDIGRHEFSKIFRASAFDGRDILTRRF